MHVHAFKINIFIFLFFFKFGGEEKKQLFSLKKNGKNNFSPTIYHLTKGPQGVKS